MMPGENKRLVGEILADLGHCTLGQVYEARMRQLISEPRKRPLLGGALVQLGYVTPEQVAEALKLQEKRPL